MRNHRRVFKNIERNSKINFISKEDKEKTKRQTGFSLNPHIRNQRIMNS